MTNWEKLQHIKRAWEEGPNSDDSTIIGAIIEMIGDLIFEHDQLAKQVEQLQAKLDTCVDEPEGGYYDKQGNYHTEQGKE